MTTRRQSGGSADEAFAVAAEAAPSRSLGTVEHQPTLTLRLRRWLPALEGGVVLFVTCAALVTRLLWLDEVPPGLFYDEAYKGLDALTMLRDRTLPVFFPGNFGREPLFIWVLAATQALFGDEPIVLRTTVATIGALTVPALYLATRELFGRLPALFAAAVLPFTLWHLVVTRVALRFAMLPWSSAWRSGCSRAECARARRATSR